MVAVAGYDISNVEAVRSSVAGWLEDHTSYTSASDVFAKGNTDDIQSLISAYAGNYQG